MQPGDVPATYADVDALARDVGFRPATPIEVGIGAFRRLVQGLLRQQLSPRHTCRIANPIEKEPAMCGLAGFFDLSSRETRNDAASIAARQIATIRYRGPDAVGLHLGPGLAMAHARLSIIDTSSAANQPMHDLSGELSIVFNGEIYNFAELRRELEAKGHRFATHSDTEVILEGYRAWGTDVVRHLHGMFAIVLYDAPRDRLVMLRDRLGKKPLVYGLCGRALVFASEAKAVLAYPGVPSSRRPGGDRRLPDLQYVPSDMSAFTGLMKLPRRTSALSSEAAR